jgi:pyridoxal phosphate enzyme (YggS family)
MNLDYFKNIKNSLDLHQEDNQMSNLRLVAVSKKHGVEKIKKLYDLGQKDFGENYVQEAIEKIEYFKDKDITWHFIGPIQSNKCQLIAKNFDWIHSIDRVKIFNKIEKCSFELNKKINYLIQINISKEESKSGLSLDDLDDFINQLNTNSARMILRGIMALPTNTNDKNILTSEFTLMQSVFNELRAKYQTIDTLSMGMSNDYQIAIDNGSTMVRIGTKIFGERL